MNSTLLTKDIERVCRISERYQGRIPRYTSYPTAIELKTVDEHTSNRGAIDALRAVSEGEVPVSLYVHLIYCKSLCYFCACNKVISESSTDRSTYVDRIAAECRILHELLPKGIRVQELHLGGGSPSYLEVEELSRLEGALRQVAELSSGVQRSVEVDPRTSTGEKARWFARAGYSRVSLGVQDCDPQVQEIVNRIQPTEMTYRCIQEYRDEGFTSVNLDLIYGLPGQTDRSLAQTVAQVIEWAPDRIALYGYAHVNWKTKVQNVFRKHPVPTPEERLKLFARAASMLVDAGYEYVGLDHFALPNEELSRSRQEGTLRRNFMGYTVSRTAGVWGVGASAISDLGGVMFQNNHELSEYSEAVSLGKLPISKVYTRTADDQVRARIIEELMCLCSLGFGSGSTDSERRRQLITEVYPHLQRFEGDGLLAIEPEQIVVTMIGRFFLRNIAAVFDAYLAGHTAGDRPVFSQAI